MRHAYSERDQQAMAVFDYVSANLDRNPDNYRTAIDGRLAVIDNGLTFPESDKYAMRSGFVADWFNKLLSPEILEGVSASTDNDVTDILTKRGIGEQGVLGRWLGCTKSATTDE